MLSSCPLTCTRSMASCTWMRKSSMERLAILSVSVFPTHFCASLFQEVFRIVQFRDISYICNSQKYFIWLSVYYMKLAWEWATDKKNANCLESLYSSCCQITLYLSAKIVFFLWIPEFSGYNLHGDFKNNPNQEWHLYRSRVHVTHRQR